MVAAAPHRCLVCEHPLHAQIWSVDDDFNEATLCRFLESATPEPIVSLRAATTQETTRLYPQLEPGRRLWITQHNDAPTPDSR